MIRQQEKLHCRQGKDQEASEWLRAFSSGLEERSPEVASCKWFKVFAGECMDDFYLVTDFEDLSAMGRAHARFRESADLLQWWGDMWGKAAPIFMEGHHRNEILSSS
jgi:hypothetical protein